MHAYPRASTPQSAPTGPTERSATQDERTARLEIRCSAQYVPVPRCPAVADRRPPAAVGMGFGAFGAHGLRARNLPQRSIDSWATASNYLVYNGLAMLAISFHPGLSSIAGKPARFRYATAMILGGALTFSGTVFGLVLAREKVGKVFGPLTPIGGMIMIAG